MIYRDELSKAAIKEDAEAVTGAGEKNSIILAQEDDHLLQNTVNSLYSALSG